MKDMLGGGTDRGADVNETEEELDDEALLVSGALNEKAN